MSEQKSVTLTLPYPVSANRYWQTRVVAAKGKRAMAITYVSPEAKAYREAVATMARLAGITEPIRGRVRLDILLYPHRPLDWAKRERLHGSAWDDTVQCIDLGNAEKVLSDALKDIVMEDDKWIRKIVSERMLPDEHGARVVVVVTAIEPINQ